MLSRLLKHRTGASLVQGVTNKFEYSNSFNPNIYSDIYSYQNFDTNIFGYSFVSKKFIRIYSDIRSCHFLDTNIFGYSFVWKYIRMSHSGTNPEQMLQCKKWLNSNYLMLIIQAKLIKYVGMVIHNSVRYSFSRMLSIQLRFFLRTFCWNSMVSEV